MHGICLGFLATESNGEPAVMRNMGAQEPELAAELVLSVMKGKRMMNGGKVVF